MCSLFRNRYRIESTRLKGYDYSLGGKYFITLCTKEMKPYLGEIKAGRMNLSKQGEIAEFFWKEIPIHFPFIILDEYIIMPNHIHGILILNSKSVQTPNLGVSQEIPNQKQSGQTPNLGVSQEISNQKPINIKYWKSNSIGSIINQYKRICTFTAKKEGFDFAWHSRFHDHIIRGGIELNRIRQYIKDNPQKWDDIK
jgi:putative transposase